MSKFEAFLNDNLEAVALVFVVLFGIMTAWAVAGCGRIQEPAKVQQELSCLDLARVALENVTSCEGARMVLVKVAKDVPACAKLWGLDLAETALDGGSVPCSE